MRRMFEHAGVARLICVNVAATPEPKMQIHP